MYNIFAQLVGFAGAVTYFIVFQQKNRKRILSLNILASAIFVVHFLLLGAYTGAAMNGICVLRCIVYYFNDKKWAKSKFWLALFVSISVISCIITWEDAYSVLPLISMTLTSVSYWLKRERNIRLLTLPSSPCWLIYNAHNASISGIITEIVISTSIIISIIRFDVLKKQVKNTADICPAAAEK